MLIILPHDQRATNNKQNYQQYAQSIIRIPFCLLFLRYGHSVTLLMTNSKAGGLPLGVLIHENQTETTYRDCLNLFKQIYKGQSPLYVMTDNSDAERNALKSIFPGNFIEVFSQYSFTHQKLYCAA